MNVKQASINHITHTLQPLFNNKKKSPTTLFNLSSSQYKRMMNNYIHLTGLSISTIEQSNEKHMLYSDSKFGSHVKAHNKWVDIGEHKWYTYIDLRKIKYNYCIVTADKKECLKWFPNTHVFGSSLTDKRGLNLTTDIPFLGVLVLMLSILPSEKDITPDKQTFDDELYSKVKSCKPNIMEKYNHHGSFGSCFSFCNKPLDGNINGKSVSVYTNKNSTVVCKQKLIDTKADKVKEILSDIIVNAVLSLSTIITDLKYLLSPIIDTGEKIQSELNDFVLQKVKSSSSGFWNAFLNVNFRT